MEKKPKVTVVTVVRNAEAALRATAESVLAQTYGNVEYVIIDGASTDGTADFVRSLGDKVDIFISEPDKGIYDAMNKGIRLATGEWVIFMNAGDKFYAPDTIAEIFDSQAYDGCGVVYGDVAKAGADGGLVVKPAGEPHNSHRMFFCHQSAFYRRSDLIETEFDATHRMSADIHQVKRLWKRGVKFRHVYIPVAIFDTGGVSNVCRSAGLRDNISVVRELDGFIDRMRLLPRLWVPYIMCRLRGK
ncbi:MAG: glycosyltransferase [Muribaculaceae bacterium]|nr:glycosyltransferase [Muribaculaceae bacterium]